jgi:hypothetical protein
LIQFDPTERAGGTMGLFIPETPGMDGLVIPETPGADGLASRAGALGSFTGSRAGRYFPCIPLHPATKYSDASAAARPIVRFIIDSSLSD